MIDAESWFSLAKGAKCRNHDFLAFMTPGFVLLLDLRRLKEFQH